MPHPFCEIICFKICKWELLRWNMIKKINTALLKYTLQLDIVLSLFILDVHIEEHGTKNMSEIRHKQKLVGKII